MEKIHITDYVIDLEFGICQPCPGVWYYPDIPTEQLDLGLLLAKSDFHEACQVTGQHFREGTYAYNQLIFSLEALYRQGSYNDTFYALKNPRSRKADSFYIEQQSAHDMYRKTVAGEPLLIGYGPKTLNILSEVLYDGFPI